jgi:hypothetical protein
MGTTQLFYGLTKDEKYFKDRLNLFVALAPATKITNSASQHLRFLSKFEQFLEKKAASLGIKEIYGKGWEAQYNRIVSKIPGGHHTKSLEEEIAN